MFIDFSSKWSYQATYRIELLIPNNVQASTVLGQPPPI
jgi:hypothetical protein